MPGIVAIFDEFSALAEQAGKNSGFTRNISQLAQRSRRFGVMLVFAGQDFKADLLNTRITNQLKTRVQFRCARREQSQIVLRQSGAERITVPGRALVRLDGKVVEVQSFWVDKQIIVKAGARFATKAATPQQATPMLDDNECAVAEVLMKPVEEGGLGGVFSVRQVTAALKGRVSYRRIVKIGQQ